MEYFVFVFVCICIYIYILEVLGWGGHCLFVPISSLTAKEKVVKRITRHAIVSVHLCPCQLRLLPSCWRIWGSLLTWSSARGISLAEDMVQARACFPFQFISKINHLSKLNVRGWLFCLNSKLVRRLIKASVCCEWIVKRQMSSF